MFVIFYFFYFILYDRIVFSVLRKLSYLPFPVIGLLIFLCWRFCSERWVTVLYLVGMVSPQQYKYLSTHYPLIVHTHYRSVFETHSYQYGTMEWSGSHFEFGKRTVACKIKRARSHESVSWVHAISFSAECHRGVLQHMIICPKRMGREVCCGKKGEPSRLFFT